MLTDGLQGQLLSTTSGECHAADVQLLAELLAVDLAHVQPLSDDSARGNSAFDPAEQTAYLQGLAMQAAYAFQASDHMLNVKCCQCLQRMACSSMQLVNGHFRIVSGLCWHPNPAGIQGPKSDMLKIIQSQQRMESSPSPNLIACSASIRFIALCRA